MNNPQKDSAFKRLPYRRLSKSLFRKADQLQHVTGWQPGWKTGRILSLLIMLLWAGTGTAQNLLQEPVRQPDWLAVNGQVWSMQIHAGKIYLAGSFSTVGTRSPFTAAINTTNGVIDNNFPKPDGTVYATAADGFGGWYIGGDFQKVGGVSRPYLAHINPDGTLDNWTANANQGVRSLLVSGTRLYVGGYFTNIGGLPRNNIAALDTATGLAISGWNPNSNQAVLSMAMSASKLYVAGYFTNIGAAARNQVAALDLIAGESTSWNPAPNSNVYSVAVSGNTVYVGGNFNTIGGVSRGKIAAFDITTGAINSWSPNADFQVSTITVSGNTVYAGGNFTNIGGAARNRIAAIDATTGLATAWNPGSNQEVRSIVVNGANVYASGYFSAIAGQTRFGIASINAVTGQANAWDPGLAGGTVEAMAVYNNTIVAVGGFVTVNSKARTNGAAFDLSTKELTAWNPNTSSTIYSIAANGGYVYLAGNFTSVGGQNRNYIAAVDTATGQVSSWNPNANVFLYAVAVHNNIVYAGGLFTGIGGQIRNHLAALDINTGQATSWNPNIDNTIQTIGFNGGNVYAGGLFFNVGGTPHNHIAALNESTGQMTPWNPNPNSTIYSFLISGNTMYMGGFFSLVNGVGRNALAAVDLTTGQLKSWNPNVSGPIYSMALKGNYLYAGGAFSTINGNLRNYVAIIDTATGVSLPWRPIPNNYVRSLVIDGAYMYMGGDFAAFIDQQTYYNPTGGFAVYRIASPSLNIAASANSVCSGTPITFTSTVMDAGTAPTYQWRKNGNSIPGATTSSYVSGGLANSDMIDCIVTSSDDITVKDTSNAITMVIHALPTISAGTDQAICSGGSITLTASGANNYSWNNGITNAMSFTPSTTNTYIVTGTDGNNCSNTDTVTVTVNNLPAVNAGPDQTVGVGASVTLSGSGASSYTWNNGVTNGNAFIASSTSSYTVIGTDGNGCSDTDEVTVNVVPAATIDFVDSVEVCQETPFAYLSYNNPQNGASGYYLSWNTDAITNGFVDVTDTILPSGQIGVAVPSGIWGDYTGFLTVTNGYTPSYYNIRVIVKPRPGVDAGPDQTACPGSLITLAGSGAQTYSWDNSVTDGLPFVQTASSVTYTVTGTAANGCENTDQITVSLHQPLITPSGTVNVCKGATTTIAAPAGAATYTWKRDGAKLNPKTSSLTITAAGVYTVTYLDPVCNSIFTLPPVTVVVNTPPSKPVITPASVKVCDGETGVLTGPGGFSYQWYMNGSPISGATNQSYSNTVASEVKLVTSSLGCASPMSNVAKIGINPLPVSGFSVKKVSKNGAVVLGADQTNASYLWYRDGNPISGATSIKYNATQSGNYALKVTKTTGCFAMSADTFITVNYTGSRTANDYPGLDDEDAEEVISIYPNPSSGVFHIETTQTLKAVVRDVQGRLVLEGNAVREIDLSKNASGIYLLQLYNDRGELVRSERLTRL